MIQQKFFLVDDNLIDTMVNTKLLNNAFDCTITSYNNATDALKFFADNSGNQITLPTALLLDVIMPRVDGFEFIEKLEEIFSRNIPFKIFLLSSTLDDADFSKARDCKSVKTILGKPLETELLKELL